MQFNPNELSAFSKLVGDARKDLIAMFKQGVVVDALAFFEPFLKEREAVGKE